MRRIILKDSDLKREVFHCGGKGGQNVNKTETGVRLTHIPTGLKAEGRSERSQHQNYQFARKLLQAKLDKLVEDSYNRERERAYQGKPEASFGQQIRTYRMCGNEQVTTDHRTGFSLLTVVVLKKGGLEGFLRAQNREGREN